MANELGILGAGHFELLERDKRASKRKSTVSKMVWQLGGNNNDSPAGIKGAIKNPADVAFISDDYFIVADSEGHRLLIFDILGNLCSVIADGEVWPNTIAVTRDSKIVTTDRKKNLIKVYDLDGHCVQAWGQNYCSFVDDVEEKPHGVAVNSKGQIIVSDIVTHSITVYSPEGKKLSKFGKQGTDVNQFNLPFYIATDQNDNILVSDNTNYCVKIMDPRGGFRVKIGSGNDWGQRQFLCPYGVAADTSGNVCIADYENHRIGMYDQHGDFIQYVLAKINSCSNPTALAFNSRGQMVYTENALETAQVKLFQMDS